MGRVNPAVSSSSRSWSSRCGGSSRAGGWKHRFWSWPSRRSSKRSRGLRRRGSDGSWPYRSCSLRRRMPSRTYPTRSQRLLQSVGSPSLARRHRLERRRRSSRYRIAGTSRSPRRPRSGGVPRVIAVMGIRKLVRRFVLCEARPLVASPWRWWVGGRATRRPWRT